MRVDSYRPLWAGVETRGPGALQTEVRPVRPRAIPMSTIVVAMDLEARSCSAVDPIVGHRAGHLADAATRADIGIVY